MQRLPDECSVWAYIFAKIIWVFGSVVRKIQLVVPQNVSLVWMNILKILPMQTILSIRQTDIKKSSNLTGHFSSIKLFYWSLSIPVTVTVWRSVKFVCIGRIFDIDTTTNSLQIFFWNSSNFLIGYFSHKYGNKMSVNLICLYFYLTH